MYRVFPLTYWLGKKIIKVKWISLVNILSDREVVRELLQSDATAANIVAELRRLTGDADHSAEIKHAYDRVRSLFSGRSASDRVSDMALEMAGLKGRTS
jgi:lipid-A-disaccharide synthase